MNLSHLLSRLNDKTLLCQQAYVDGAWVDADHGETFEVNDPATGDFGPVHIDDGYVSTTRFGKRLAPGILVAGICTSVLTADLVGTLGVSIEDRFWFTGPVFYGDTLNFRVWIEAMDEGSRSVVWRASATNEEEREVLKAEATLRFPRPKPAVA